MLRIMHSAKLFLKYLPTLRPYWFPVVVSTLSEFFAIIISMVPPLLSIIIFDYAYPQADLYLFTVVSVAGLVIYFLHAFFNAANEYNDLYVDQKIGASLSHRLFEKILSLPILKQMKLKTGDLTVRILDDADIVTGLIINALPVMAIHMVQLVLYFYIVVSIDPFITLLALASIPFYLLETHFFSGRLEQLKEETQQTSANIYDNLQERLMNYKTIKAFHREGHESQQFSALFSSKIRLNIKEKIISIISTFTDSLTMQVWGALIIWFLGYQVIKGNITVGQAVAMGAYLPMMESPIRALASLYTNLRIGMVSLRRVDEILFMDNGETQEQKDNPTALIKTGHIEVDKLDFFFNQEHKIITGLSLDIPAQSSLAIVGESGSGKSTLFNLLIKFYAPSAGIVLLDGHHIQQIEVNELRSKIGIVFQEISLFQGTISQNICYGKPNASREEMVEAAERAGIHEHISTLPDGYETGLDKLGHNLSGGQRQRIAIARALLLKPKILILDEATSALDAESEFIIQDTLRRCKKDMTILFVAHRIASVKSFDTIIVLDEGKIVEQGSYPDLMKKKGIFFTLSSLQTGGFETFIQRLELELERQRRYDQQLSLVVFEINTPSGKLDPHNRSRLLEEIDLVVKRLYRIMDFSSVFQDNKILVGLPDTSQEGAEIFAQRVISKLHEKPISFEDKQIVLKITHGSYNIQSKLLIYSEDFLNRALEALQTKQQDNP